MARLCICDCCGKQITTVNTFEYYIHLDDIANGKLASHHDRDMNAVSSRPVIKEFCNKCYNDVVMPSVEKFYELKQI